jgi:hypothetical protein
LQECVTPLQTTFPFAEQEVPSVEEHEPVPEQVTVTPNGQLAVQVDFNGRGRPAAARAGSSVCGVCSPVTAGCPKMAAKASCESGAGLGVWARPAMEIKRAAHPTNRTFLIAFSSLVTAFT